MKNLFLSLLAIAMLAGCGDNSRLKSDPEATADFEARRDSLNAPQYFEVFDQEMPADVRAGMEFLYAYMPLPDITDYPGEYFKQNVELALRTREEMPWGKAVPDREFRHFVLPVRVNNENLDGHRQVFYDELKERVKGMSMEEAILEVNHWCHEKVTYEPSDPRTHSPLASVSSGIGRCGEESTFTVAALRSIGIPARQVYTPRWAHTDDNHAWVEAWANGKWHFLGACEPEAVLDLGWFNAPASRGMLMNTRAIGRYDGPEEKLLEMPAYTDINVTDNYAAIDTLTVTVVDANGKAIADADVAFCLYNYAEFYPLARKKADAQGQASLVVGKGDLIVLASHQGNYTMAKVATGKENNVEIAVTNQSKPQGHITLDIVPPKGNAVLPKVPQELTDENLRRKDYEDSVRLAYVGTFTDDSRGNRATLDKFLASLPESDKARGQQLIDNLSLKDRTDVTYEVLCDAMLAPAQDSPLYAQYVLSPRIEHEYLVPFREKFANAFTAEQQQAFRDNPSSWAKWVVDSIATDLTWQPASIRMSPWAVWELRRTNAPSRNVFFVAAARAMGIPSRVDPVTGKPQYVDNQGQWQDMLASDTGISTPQGTLALKFEKKGYIADPTYYSHFAISKVENGHMRLLEYPEEATWSELFSKPVTLDAGEYMLMSGQRIADGSVLAAIDFFTIEPGKLTTLPFSLRQDSNGIKVIGSFNSEDKYHDLATATDKTILSTTGRGYYVLGIVGGKDEPSNHALRDIAAIKAELEANGMPMIVLFPDEAAAKGCALTEGLPSTASLGVDLNGEIRKEIAEKLRLSNHSLPIFIIADTFNRVVFVSEGYSIGLGRQLLDTAAKL